MSEELDHKSLQGNDLPLFTEIRPDTDEEDRYIKMKDLYKQGKVDAEDLLGAGVTGDEMALQYTHDPDLIQQYLNGWNYQMHVMSEWLCRGEGRDIHN